MADFSALNDPVWGDVFKLDGTMTEASMKTGDTHPMEAPVHRDRESRGGEPGTPTGINHC